MQEEFDLWLYAFAEKHGLGAGDRVALVDLDNTLWEPDVWQWMVNRFADDPEIWHQADRNIHQPNSEITRHQLFQLALDLCSRNKEFEIKRVVEEVTAIHHLVPGSSLLTSLIRTAGVKPLAVTNGLTVIACALTAHHGLTLPVIGNEVDVDNGSFNFRGLTGEAGVDKDVVACGLVELGVVPVVGIGDSLSDTGLIEAAIRHGGVGLARKGRKLAEWCGAGFSAGRLRAYDTFDDEVIDWVLSALNKLDR